MRFQKREIGIRSPADRVGSKNPRWSQIREHGEEETHSLGSLLFRKCKELGLKGGKKLSGCL